MKMEVADLCGRCTNEQHVPGLDVVDDDGLLHMPSTTSAGDRSTEYTVTLRDLSSSVKKECPWCLVVFRSLHAGQVANISDELVQVKKTYRSTSVRNPSTWQHVMVLSRVYDAAEPSTTQSSSLVMLRIHPSNESSTFATTSPRVVGDQQFFEGYHAVNNWLRECAEQHTDCCSSTTTFLPTRTLDVKPSISGDYRLYESKDLEPGEYAALSYCWGIEQTFVARTENIATLRQTINPQQLPVVVQDAARVAQSLGIWYLWVDAFCILQNSPEDINKELPKIRTIFRDAHITILASRSASVHEPFLEPSGVSEEKSTRSFRIFQRNIDRYIDVEFIHSLYNPSWEPVNSRAWTLEERLLSRRVVLFTKSGPMWECQQVERSLDDRGANPFITAGRERILNANLARASNALDVKGLEVHRLWQDIVQDYCDRKLTMEADKLIAIGGIAEEFHVLFGKQLGKYTSGIRTQYLRDGLCWEAVSVDGKWPNALMFYRSPTWTWASVRSPIIFRKAQQDENVIFTFKAELCLDKPKMDFLAPSHREIYIEAPGVKAIWKPSYTDLGADANLHLLEPDGRIGECIGKASPDAWCEMLERSVEVTAMLLMLWESSASNSSGSLGILLVRDGAKYKRIGSYRGFPEDTFLDAATSIKAIVR